MSGYGFVLFCGPLLSILYEPTSVVLMSLIMGTILLGGLLSTSENRRLADSRVALGLTVCSIPGMFVGLWLLPRLNESVFRVVVGSITLLFVLSRLWGFRILIPNHSLGIVVAGFLGGVFSVSTGLSSLPIIWFLGSQNFTPLEYRATIASYVFLNGVISIMALVMNGATRAFDFSRLLFLSPALLIGLIIGTILTRKLSQDQLERGSLLYLGVIVLLTFLHIKF